MALFLTYYASHNLNGEGKRTVWSAASVVTEHLWVYVVCVELLNILCTSCCLKGFAAHSTRSACIRNSRKMPCPLQKLSREHACFIKTAVPLSITHRDGTDIVHSGLFENICLPGTNFTSFFLMNYKSFSPSDLRIIEIRQSVVILMQATSEMNVDINPFLLQPLQCMLWWTVVISIVRYHH